MVTLKQILADIVSAADSSTGEDFREIAASTFRVDGGIGIEDLGERLGVKLPVGEYDTVAGLVLQHLGHLPKEGESLRIPGAEITVEAMSGVRIKAVRITLLGGDGDANPADSP